MNVKVDFHLAENVARWGAKFLGTVIHFFCLKTLFIPLAHPVDEKTKTRNCYVTLNFKFAFQQIAISNYPVYMRFHCNVRCHLNSARILPRFYQSISSCAAVFTIALICFTKIIVPFHFFRAKRLFPFVGT